MEEEIFQLKQEEYRKIHAQWREIHYYVLVSMVIITTIVEGVMFFVVRKMNMIICTIPEYLLKYLLVPVLANVLILLAARYVLRKKISPTLPKIILFLCLLLEWYL